MQTLMPDLSDALRAAGAVEIDLGTDVRWYHYGGYKCALGPSEFKTFSQSRPILESLVRERVLARPNVTCLTQSDAVGLLTDANRTRVTGVRIQRRALGREEELQADLVIDASGRASRTPQWLETLGYSKPPKTTVTIDYGTSTRLFRRRPGDEHGAKGMIAMPEPPDRRYGAAMHVENDQWMVIIGGRLGDHSPSDEQAYLDYARSLSSHEIYDLVRTAEPVTEPMLYKCKTSVRHHYDRCRMPERFLVLGDAVATFNPAYGQGMTVAAQSAEILHTCLEQQRGGLDGLSRRFMRRAAGVVNVAWTTASSEDFQWSETGGARPFGTKVRNWLARKVHRASSHSREVCQAYYGVLMMTHSPTSLFRPALIWQILRGKGGGVTASSAAQLPPAPPVSPEGSES